MNFNKLIKELMSNAKQGKYEANEILYDDISNKVRKLNDGFDQFKKYHKLYQPRLCTNCNNYKHKR